MKTLITNGRVITPFRIIENGNVIVENGKIVDMIEGEINFNESEARCIDAQGNYISPGFIDMHVHGGGNCEVMDGTVDSIRRMCSAHAAYGTTSIVPATMAAPWDDTYKAIDAVREAQKDSGGAKILGVHLEGPYFSSAEKGAQSPEYIKDPDPSEYMKVLDYWDGIIIMSAAPEIAGALGLGRELRKRGILAAIAHSNANYDDIIKALENGYSHITHLYSGCSVVHRVNAYRIAGVVESGYLMDELTVDIIADGKHLPTSLLKLIYKAKGADRIALITDGLSFSASPVKEQMVYRQKNGIEVIFEDNVMKLIDRTSFAGSVTTTNRLVQNMIELADVSLLQAVKMATYTPAKILRINNRKGSLSIGMDADVLIFDSDLDVKLTMVEGNIVFSK